MYKHATLLTSEENPPIDRIHHPNRDAYDMPHHQYTYAASRIPPDT